jgi:hypothetical protein
MNDYERNQWVDNDEGLYNWWHRSGLSKSAFIREHRNEIDAAINRVLSRPPREKTWRDYASNYGSHRTRRGQSRSRWGGPLSRNEKIAVGVLAVVGGVVVVKSVAG